MYECETPSAIAAAAGSASDPALSPQTFRDAKPVSEVGPTRLFDRLLKRLPEVFAIARSVGFNDTDAADVVQNVALKGWEAIQKGTIRDLEKWLPPVAFTSAFDILRQNKRHSYVSLDRIEEPMLSEQAAFEEQRAEAISEAIAQLPKLSQSLVEFCYLQGRTSKEAREVFGATAGTVAGRLFAARNRLRAILGRTFPELLHQGKMQNGARV